MVEMKNRYTVYKDCFYFDPCVHDAVYKYQMSNRIYYMCEALQDDWSDGEEKWRRGVNPNVMFIVPHISRLRAHSRLHEVLNREDLADNRHYRND